MFSTLRNGRLVARNAAALRRVVAPRQVSRNDVPGGRMHYAEAATPAKSAGSAVAKKHLEAKQKIGFVHGIDGTIATIAPAASKVTVPYNTVLEIAVSATNIANALVFNLEKDGSIGVILLDNISEVRSGQDVYATGSLLKIPVGFHMLGKIINPLGKEIPTGLFTKAAPLLDDTKLGLVEEMAPNIVSRQPVNYNLLTGYKV